MRRQQREAAQAHEMAASSWLNEVGKAIDHHFETSTGTLVIDVRRSASPRSTRPDRPLRAARFVR